MPSPSRQCAPSPLASTARPCGFVALAALLAVACSAGGEGQSGPEPAVGPAGGGSGGVPPSGAGGDPGWTPPPDTGGGAGGEEGGAIVTNCNQDVDVVFTLDVSGSMVSPLTFVQNEVAKVDAALQAKNLPSPPHYGLVIFVDDVIVLNGAAPYPDVVAFAAAVTEQINLTNTVPTRQCDPALEANASWPENSLDALFLAATMFQWRPAATTLRTIIHLTDASFWDGNLVSSAEGDPLALEPAGQCSVGALIMPPGGCTMTSSAHTYEETIQALRDNQIWVNTFAALTGGPPVTGVAVGPASHGPWRGVEVNVGIGFHEPYRGLNSIAVSTGGLAWDIDAVFDGFISLADPINQAIEDRQCVEYPPPPPPPTIQ